VQSLPDPVDAIDHGVVQPEDRVDGRTEEVTGDAAHDAVAGGVQAQEAVREAALKLVLEGQHGARGGARGDVEDVAERQPIDGRVGAQVAAQTMRVITQGGRRRGHAVLDGKYGAKVDLVVDEGSGCHAATALARGDPDVSVRGHAAVVQHVGAIAAEASVATVE